MTQTRRHFLASSAAAGAITMLPVAARASDTFETAAGPLTVHPVSHASFVMETPRGTIYVDPVDNAARYQSLPPPDLILITHEHGDHFNPSTLRALITDGTALITNPAVFAKLPVEMQARTSEIANGAVANFADMPIEAIPAYNTTEDRKAFHPEGRDNGYVLNFDGFRTYVSGDTEDTPEMRGLTDIELAFVCMNVPFTMDSIAAASAVSEFAPTYVYPYQYRNRDGGFQDPERFARMLGGETVVKLGPWYG